MKDRNDWPWLSDSQLETEINERIKLVDQMVGTLYPGILRNEIDELTSILDDRRIKEQKRSINRDF